MTQNTRPILEVRALHKSYGSFSVLRGMNLAVYPGEVIGLIGPNGCGKSTFLRCLNQLESFQQGEVYLRGECVGQGRPQGQEPSAHERTRIVGLRRRLGMVFQQFNLFPHMDVLQNVMCGPQKVLKQDRAEAIGIAEEMLHKVGLYEKRLNRPSDLSGGQQQRVAIARALAMRPEVMLFDEPTSALDPQMTKEVQKVMQELAAQGMTMLVVSHDIKLVERISHRVVFVNQGKVEVEGPPNEILLNPPTESLREFLKQEL